MKNGFIYHFVELPPNNQLGLHSQPSWELSVVFIGKGKRIIGDTTASFSSGDIVLVPPDMDHCWYFCPDCVDKNGNIVNATLMFSKELIIRLADMFPMLRDKINALINLETALTLPKRYSINVSNILYNMRRLSDIQRIPKAIEIILEVIDCLMLSQVVGHKSHNDAKLLKFKQVEIFVLCNYARQIGIADIAFHVGMNKSSFCEFFRNATNKTFVTYLNEFRLSQARYFLTTRSFDTISSIAYSCGFQTISHFNHLFKRYYGVSPKVFLQQKEGNS